MKRALALYFALLLPFAVIHVPQAFGEDAKPVDPYLWLEDIDSAQAMAWVQQQNDRTAKYLEAQPLYPELLAQAKQILFAKDRVPFATFTKGYFWNFWEDETHTHGILRRTTYDEYLKAEPKWETILDLDKISAAENENWVYGGMARLTRTSKRAMVRLSRGGRDAVVEREYDLDTHDFVPNGFAPPEGRTRISALDENTLLIAANLGEDSLTTSGYCRTIKLWHRGEALTKAKTLFEVRKTDLSAGMSKIEHGAERHILFYRVVDFYNQFVYVQNLDGSLAPIRIPPSAELIDIRDGQVYFQLKQDFNLLTGLFQSGDILRMDLATQKLRPQSVVFRPKKGQSVQGISVQKDRVLINLLENVRSRVLELSPTENGLWTTRALPFPTTGLISLIPKRDDDPTDFLTIYYTDHLTPNRQYRVHDEDGSYRMELLKGAVDRFDASGMEVLQQFATSKDGTKIPYFLLQPKNLVLDGSHPTVLYGYGGFNISLTPEYSGSIGKLWLERGHVYVVANIRGGDEFGPEWHQAALRENRQRAFDDFAAVAEDLIARKITSPSHLGISGGSNGGLLTGTVMVQRPELFNAALIQVPLLDMLRYNKLLAGASWMGEYGDPDVPADRKFIERYSPYQNVRADVKYPMPLLTTSTKDDRVHPGHARKMVARMSEQGHPVLYYENINGGHGGSANLEETAHLLALEYTYLCERLLTK